MAAMAAYALQQGLRPIQDFRFGDCVLAAASGQKKTNHKICILFYDSRGRPFIPTIALGN